MNSLSPLLEVIKSLSPVIFIALAVSIIMYNIGRLIYERFKAKRLYTQMEQAFTGWLVEAKENTELLSRIEEALEREQQEWGLTPEMKNRINKQIEDILDFAKYGGRVASSLVKYYEYLGNVNLKSGSQQTKE
ncbi:MAG: hypothetical protein AMJ41_05370 [candidate division Zixibacteria bacterium DG_27]|nr:MAG: hypothetical protein AMJ41_05370 [candidate division Zixibacteria bacterium DG_27]